MSASTSFHGLPTDPSLNLDACCMVSDCWPEPYSYRLYIECEETGDTLLSKRVESSEEAAKELALYLKSESNPSR